MIKVTIIGTITATYTPANTVHVAHTKVKPLLECSTVHVYVGWNGSVIEVNGFVHKDVHEESELHCLIAYHVPHFQVFPCPAI